MRRSTAAVLVSGVLAAMPVVGGSQAAPRRPTSQPYTWRNVAIVAGGFVTGIVFHPKERGLAYARTDMGGAYRWDNPARRWVPLTDWAGADDWNLLGIESLAVDPTDPTRVYLAAGTYTNNWAGNGCILRSSDRGRTWKRTPMPLKFGGNEDGRSIGERLAVDPSHPALLYLGTRHDGLWRSADRGATWSKVASFPVTARTNGVGIGFVLFDARGTANGHPTRTIYVGVAAPGTGLYRSRNAGARWEAVSGQPAGLLPHHAALADDGVLYVTYGDRPGPNGMTDGAVWRLDTGTGSWTDITPVKPAGSARFGYAGLAIDARRPGTVVVATMDRWGPGDDLFRTTDGGRTWTALGAKATRDPSISPYLKWGGTTTKLGWWIGSVAIDPFDANHALYVTGATIWGTQGLAAADRGQGTHWAVEGQGVEQVSVLDLASPPAGPHLLSGMRDLGGFRHDDLAVSPRGGMFANPVFGEVTSLDFAEKVPTVVVRVGGAGGGARRGAFSTDGGATWTPFAGEPPGSRGGGTVAVSADGGAILWAAEGADPAVTRDRGATWVACTGLPRGARVVSDRVKPARFYAVDRQTGALYASGDGGRSFAAIPGAPAVRDAKLRTAPGREGDLWLAAGDAGLFRCPAAGTPPGRLGTVDKAEAVGFGKAAPGRTYPAVYLAGTVRGVRGLFRSDDTGVTWVRINDDQHQYGWVGQCVTGDPRVYGRVYVATNGRGIVYGEPVRGQERR